MTAPDAVGSAVAPPARETALAMRGLVKAFGATRALDGATLSVEAGTVHGLVGQNGAGKSTLIKVLAGLVAPDAGAVELFGAPLADITPARAASAGIAFIHQERLLVPSATAGEALFLGREATASRFGVRRGRFDALAQAALKQFFGLSLPRGALIRDLTTAQQQIVQITRALLAEPRLVVFDEPTAALTRVEVENLFRAIAQLRAAGLTVLYISHYLSEIERICDAVTVLRNGRDVARLDPRATSIAAITRLMVGRDVKDLFPKPAIALGGPVLTVRGLSRPGAFADVSFALRRGEVLGLTGLVDSGAKDLVQTLFGLAPAGAGEVEVDGRVRRFPSPAAAVRRGLALVPEDRRGRGVDPDMSVRENVTLASLGRFSRWGWLKRGAERREAARLVADLGVRAAGPEAAVRTLSGGNQQKVALAKWLSRSSTVYVLDEPTVGVDVAAKVDIYRLIGRLAERGAAVLVLSTDLDELLGVCDRVLVMFRGRIVSEHRAAETGPDRLLDAALTGRGTAGEPARAV